MDADETRAQEIQHQAILLGEVTAAVPPDSTTQPSPVVIAGTA